LADPQTPFIRRAAPADAESLADAADRTFRDAWQHSTSRADLDAYCREQFSPDAVAAAIGSAGETWLLAEVDGVAGYARLVDDAPPSGVGGMRPIQLSRLYTFSKWHGRGIGPALMRASLRAAAMSGHDVLWLSVWKQAPQSQAFYRKWGFERVGEDRFMFGSTVYEDWLLQREVPPDRPLVALRRYRPGDAGPILALFRDTIRRVNRRDYTPAQVEAWAQPGVTVHAWAARLRDATFVVEADGQIVAFAELDPDGHVDCFFCHADWQGQGLGSMLMEHLAREARAAGAPSLYAEVSLTARPFFERHGFAVEVQQEVPVGNERLANFRMRRSL
jgi:putative acetyltransferase